MWNFSFSQNKDYYLNQNIESVRLKIQAITQKKWSDFSENITGVLEEDNSFKLSQKWQFIHIGWLENRVSYLSGCITKEGSRTKISTKARPNPMIVFLYYFFISMIICELAGIDTFLNAGPVLNVVFYLIWVLVMYGCIRYFPRALQNRFERLLKIEK